MIVVVAAPSVETDDDNTDMFDAAALRAPTLKVTAAVSKIGLPPIVPEMIIDSAVVLDMVAV